MYSVDVSRLTEVHTHLQSAT